MSSGFMIEIMGKPVKIEYSEGDIHVIGLMDMPFEWIKQGLKSVEIRANSDVRPFDYSVIKPGHTLRLINEQTGESLERRVIRVDHYQTVKELLNTEGMENTLPTLGAVADAIELIHSFPGYKQGIAKYGVYAIEIQ
ncbi:ASCH domain-containing protein [Zooshikella harenae]|uniref:ASCH domain-containing protein n=1 Tax=Zooshikella harenae TaxID=2827238 RepID=A0ABS5Z7Z3_9GAMM|nr:ASCH domain-containing protein [Zooshikella harenae]MBU2710167.1 hypothetical protein [Zooshikella harenae]